VSSPSQWPRKSKRFALSWIAGRSVVEGAADAPPVPRRIPFDVARHGRALHVAGPGALPALECRVHRGEVAAEEAQGARLEVEAVELHAAFGRRGGGTRQRREDRTPRIGVHGRQLAVEPQPVAQGRFR